MVSGRVLTCVCMMRCWDVGGCADVGVGRAARRFAVALVLGMCGCCGGEAPWGWENNNFFIFCLRWEVNCMYS